MKILLISSLLILAACVGSDDEKNDLKFFSVPVEAKDFDIYVNQKDLPENPDLTADRMIVNEDYPIEIVSIKMGNGITTFLISTLATALWEFKDGRLKLFAERRLFDMHIDIVPVEEQAKEVIVKFRDRFGPKFFRWTKKILNSLAIALLSSRAFPDWVSYYSILVLSLVLFFQQKLFIKRAISFALIGILLFSFSLS